ncbi:MAG: hypothetical protein ABL887_04420 [Nitrosomonas sp.]
MASIGYFTRIGALSFFSKLFNESGCSLYATWLALSVVLVSMGERFTPPLRNTQDVGVGTKLPEQYSLYKSQ